MCVNENEARLEVPSRARHDSAERTGAGVSRRGFLGGLGGAALGGLTLPAAVEAGAASAKQVPGTRLPLGAPLRLKPALAYQLPRRAEKSSWRSYGGLQTPADVSEEAKRIEAELKRLASQAEFPVEVLPLALMASDQQVKEVADADCDAILVYAASGGGRESWAWFATLAASKAPMVMFLRHKSGPYYLWHEIAHWRLLRRNGDTLEEPNMDVDDIVVDDYGEVLWRLRGLYGLKNAKGTKMLAIGGLQAYSKDGQALGPAHAKEIWGYRLEIISDAQFAKRLQQARSSEKVLKEVERQTDQLLAQPNVVLQTERKFVVNSFLALGVCKEILKETGATNFGFAHCMGRGVIEMLDTPPCLVLSLANDEGYTAYCHTDLTHTLPGVLLRWIAGKPTFVCNSHFPHHGIFTVAHCAAPRRMNGRDYEPARIMTHFESGYGAATKVEYSKGQVVTVVIPNLRCSKWQGFRGRILDSPSLPACRSQIDIQVDGDFRRLLAEMEGFHVQVCYGDYLREIGYALKKLGRIEWQNFSEKA
ncbi:MAG: sugar isomerase [Planctomycetota bacterium]|jgi:L-fucose isomerase-like protein